MSRHIGIYTGTFDPVHNGHVSFGQAARDACQLDEVIFIPEHQPRGKAVVTDISHRAAMLELALRPHHQLSSTVLVSQHFTIAQTLPELKQAFPDTELTLLIGSDVARTLLYRWEGLEQLLPEVRLAVGLRGSDTAQQLRAIMKQVQFVYQQPVHYAIVLPQRAATASSSLARGGNHGHISPDVQTYIRQHNLYG